MSWLVYNVMNKRLSGVLDHTALMCMHRCVDLLLGSRCYVLCVALTATFASDFLQQACASVEVMPAVVLWHGEHSCGKCRLLSMMYRVQALWS